MNPVPALSSRILTCSLAAFGAAHAADAPRPGEDKASTLTLTAVVQPDGAKAPKPPFFHEARVRQESYVTPGGVLHYVNLDAGFLQGDAELISLEITGGAAEVVKVDGPGVSEWAMRRTADGRRFLDLRTTENARAQKTFAAAILARSEVPAGASRLTAALFLPGNAASGDLRLTVSGRDGRFVQPEAFSGLTHVRAEGERLAFVCRKGDAPALTLITGDAASAADAVVLENFALKGDAGEDALTFTLTADAVVRDAGAGIPILRGEAALAGLPSGARVVVREDAGTPVIWLQFEKPGRHRVSLNFVARLQSQEGLSRVSFAIPGSRVAPFTLAGFPKDTRFESAGAPLRRQGAEPEPNPLVMHIVAPARNGDTFAGFLPPGGELNLAWKVRREEARAKCFYTTDELTDIRVGDGLAAQNTRITFRVLQGECDRAVFDLVGDGEVLAVRGDDIRTWQVVPGDAGKRRLEITLARARDGEFAIAVDTRTALGGFPATFKPVRVTPTGAVRHGGLARITGKGAVRLAVTPSGALTQINPNRFPGATPAEAAAFAYRVSAPEASFRVQAEDVMPEVAVTQSVVHRVNDGETAIEADLELEIREAPLREFTVRVPAGFTATMVAATDLAEHRLADAKPGEPAGDGLRPLLLTFAKPVSGKQLIRIRLEKTGAPGAAYAAKAFAYPGVKSVRGFLGFAAAPGLRLTATGADNLAEIAAAFFPAKAPGLQHAFRMRDAAWSAGFAVERLAQAVQSDVLHQYLVRDGAIAAGTVVNYVIVGAPVAALRFAVPKEARNLEFTGGDIRAWKRDGDTVEVALNRPVLGAFTLLATFELPLDARGGEADLSGVRPLDVQSEQGHVLVTAERPYAVLSKNVPKGLTVIEPAEIPAEYKLLADAPLLAAYQYTGGDTGLRLDLRPRDTGDALGRVVDFSELKTKVGADGQTVTEMRCLVKSRGRSALRVAIPAGSRLWTVTVDDKETLPASAGTDAVLVTLPAKTDPNAITTVALRLAGPSAGDTAVKLTAPALDAPIMQTSWTVVPDAGRRLVNEGGDLTRTHGRNTAPPSPRTAGAAAVTFLVAAAGLIGAGIASRRRARQSGKGGPLFTLAMLTLAGGALYATITAVTLDERRSATGALHFSASLIEAGKAPALALAQLAEGSPNRDLATVALAALALGFMTRGIARRGKGDALVWRAAGWGAAAGAAVSGTGGYAAALGVAAAFTAVELIPGAWRSWRRAAPAGAASLLALAALALAPDRLDAKSAAAQLPPGPTGTVATAAPMAEAIAQTLRLEGDRWRATGEIRIGGVTGDTFELLRAPAALTAIETPEGVRLTRGTEGGVTVFRLTLDKPGSHAVKFAYELPVTGEAGEIALPTGRAAADSLTISAANADRTVGARGAVSRRTDAAGAVNAVFPMRGERSLVWGPKTRDVRTESLVFYAETANLFTLSPGLAEGRHRVQVRPSRGLVSELTLDVPKALAVSGVTGDGVGDWRFDPETGTLRVSIVSRPVSAPGGAGAVPSASLPFTLIVETQAATGALPAKLALAPLVVRGAAGATGLLAIASANEVAITAATPDGLAAVNPDDFPGDLARADGSAETPTVVRRAYRHGAGAAALAVELAAVEPELRVESESTVSVGEDRTVLTEAMTVSIRRSGVFSLKCELPQGYDIESVSGDALSHWSESREDGKRLVTVHLRGRTLGERRFHFTLAGPGVSAAKRWQAPSLALQGATRRTGKLLIVPEEGLRLHAIERSGVTQTDPGRTVRKGSLAFGVLQSDWKLAFEAETAAPWIRCDWLQDVTLTDGRVRVSSRFEYTVENAAVKAVRVRLPAKAEGVRITGELVGDAAHVPGQPGQWEVKLRRRTLGKLTFEAAYRMPGGEPGKAFAVDACAPADAAVRNGWLAVRPSGRLAVAPEGGKLPDTLRAADWAGVPAALRRGDSEATLVMRAGEPDYALPLTVTANDPAKLLPVRVRTCELYTMLGSDGAALTRVRLELSITDKRAVRFTPPAGAKLWHAFVNDRTVRPAVEGADFLVPAEPNPDPAKPAVLELWYAAKGVAPLPAPKFELPLENITWSVRLPEGVSMTGWKGDFRETVRAEPGLFDGPSSRGGYAEKMLINDARQLSQAKSAESLLKLGNEYKVRGDQEKALQALNLARSLSNADAALNEDARVQYNNLRLEQIEYGLNRRRNAALADNGLAPAVAAPAPQGVNFTAEQADQLRSQNAAEDNAALRKLAERFVALQQGAAAAPEGIRTLAPEDGRRVTFTKALQTGANADLRLELALRRDDAFSGVAKLLAALGAGALALVALVWVRRKP